MGFLSCCLHFDGFRDSLAAPSENSPCFSRVDLTSFHRAPVERVGKLVVRIRIRNSAEGEGERQRSDAESWRWECEWIVEVGCDMKGAAEPKPWVQKRRQ